MILRRQFRIWIGLCLATYILAGCAGLAGEPAIVTTLAPEPTRQIQPISLPQTAPDVTLGAQVYADNCTRCHGLTGAGDGEMVQLGQVVGVPDFTNPQTARDAAPIAWFEIVTNGRLENLMPPWGDKLSEDQRWAVTMYVYTLATAPEQVAQGQSVWMATCAECHGEAGEGAETENGAPLPNLLEISTADLLLSLADGLPDEMHNFADELSESDRLAVIAYARTLTLANISSPHEVASAPTAAPEDANPQPITTEEVGAANPQPATTEEANAPTAVNGVVTGTVINMTAGGAVPSDLTLNLHVVSDQNGSSAGDILQTTLNADGTYRFEDVPMQTGWQYVVVTTYNGTAFSSEVLEGDSAQPQLELPLTIYEVAADPANIQIDGILTMVQTQPNQLEVVQIISFANTSDQVFLKQDEGTQSSVSVRLPQGAVFEDFSGGSYLISADGTQVTDTQPIMPGSNHVMHLAFTMPYSGNASIEQTVDYPLNGSVEVMVGSDELSINGEGFAELGTRQLGDRTYRSYGGNLSKSAGESVRYQVQGSVVAAQTTTDAIPSVSPFAYVLIGAGLLAIGAAFGFFMRERTTPRPVVETAAPTNPQINTLMKQIGDLDIEYNAGKIGEAKYQKRRAALKAQLVALMKEKADRDS